jgi:hypothetical protein
MPSPAPRRRLLLLGVVAAVLAVAGIFAVGEAATGGSVADAADHPVAASDDDGSSFRAAEAPAVVRVGAHRLRPIGHVIPLVTVPVTAVAALVAARRAGAASTPVRRRPAVVWHRRRRGPPALLVA